MNTTEQFFFDNAGYSYDPLLQTPEQGRIESAKKLAEAERWLNSTDDVEITWGPDDSPDLSWMDDEERKAVREVVGCVLKIDGESVASLSGVVDPDQSYCRVVEAELALEAMLDRKVSV